jgi:glycosyltransferase involved in cell wall biosynthesis
VENNNFKIIVPLYNVEKWIKNCIRSVKAQTYKNFQCYLVDDLSTDGTKEKILEEIKGDKRFFLISNTQKKYALKNIHDTLQDVKPDKNDIVVILDGDDWLSSAVVLEKLDNIYNIQKCWMTYGSYIEYPAVKKKKGKFAKKIPHNIIKEASYRDSTWMASHLRTFRYGLWKKIDKKDFIFSKTKKFVKAAWDFAFVFPLLEMCGARAVYVSDILYVYNRSNPLNEDKINHDLQLSEAHEVRNKKKYKLLENL